MHPFLYGTLITTLYIAVAVGLMMLALQLGELIKQEVAADKDNIRRNSLGYFGITAIISAFWFASIPVWKPFMTHVLGFTEMDKLFGLVMLLVGFYVLYAIQNVSAHPCCT